VKIPILVLSIIAAASFALLALAGPGFADPSVPNIAPHQHFLVTATGEWIAIGPQVCPPHHRLGGPLHGGAPPAVQRPGEQP
jgi:hypothetical protein